MLQKLFNNTKWSNSPLSTFLHRSLNHVGMSSLPEKQALVIGCGVAGSATALRLASHGVQVTMLSAANEAHECNSYWAQGGIIYKGKDDPPELLAQDIHSAGAGVSFDPAVQKLTREGPQRVEEMLLQVAKVPFQRQADGELALTLEASHSRPRIVYKADHTGKAITTSLLKAVQQQAGIQLELNQTVVELAKSRNGACVGAYVLNNTTLELDFIPADLTVLATGGMGDLYLNTSNPEGARGHGLALAEKMGAAMNNLQYVQFHPTTLFMPGERRFLLTEALRGEGGRLLNQHGHAFAASYHPLKELAPRDVVARMILAEMEKEQQDCMYLDISHHDAAWLQERFPSIYEHCLARGLDLTKEPMPVVPAAHYHCGGVQVDLQGRTNVPGLYAAGEVACTGLHGANRLASTSLLEGVVWGASIADSYLAEMCSGRLESAPLSRMSTFHHSGTLQPGAPRLEQLWSELRTIMWERVGPVRTLTGLQSAVDELERLQQRVERMYQRCALTPETVSLRNGVIAAKLVAEAALHDPKSIGTHYLVDDAEEEVLNASEC